MDKHTPPTLSNYSIFAELPAAGLERLQAGLRRIELEAGEEIIRPGEFGDFLGIVTEGELALETERGARQRVRDSGLFGEGMLRYGVPSSFRGLAIEEAVVWLVTRPEYLAAQVIGNETRLEDRREPVVTGRIETEPEKSNAGTMGNPGEAPDVPKKAKHRHAEVQSAGENPGFCTAGQKIPEANSTGGIRKPATGRGRRWLRWSFFILLLVLAWVILSPMLLPAVNRSVVDLLVKSGNLKGAESYLQLAFRLQPDSADLFDGLGAVLYIQGRVDEALDPLKQAVELDPELASAHNNLAVAMMASGDSKSAVPHLEKAVELDPGDALLFYNLGNAYLQSDRRADAEHAYRRAMELEPENQTTRARWAEAAAALGETRQAQEVWEGILSGATGEVMAVALSYQIGHVGDPERKPCTISGIPGISPGCQPG